MYKSEVHNLGNGEVFKANCNAAMDEAALIIGTLNESKYACLNVLKEDYEDELVQLEAFAEQWHDRFDDVVIVGTGGSCLGAAAITSIYESFGNACRPYYLDNLDVRTIELLIEKLDFQRTGFLFISKTGSTVEVIGQAIVLLDKLDATVGRSSASSHVAVVTMHRESPLQRLALDRGFQIFCHHPKVGGRYSVFTNVAALPALVAGCNIREMRRGAVDVLMRVNEAMSPPVIGASMMTTLIRQSVEVNILAAYEPRLRFFNQWHRQLWAESLGKGGHGTTPAPALGPVDQHSQLQLWLDGPDTKVITLIISEVAGKGLAIQPKDRWGLDYLRGRTIGDIVAASARATAETLIDRGCPLRILHVDDISERSLGALFMHFILETLITAQLIGVDPFDQPAVDHGKALVRKYLEAGNMRYPL